MRFPTVTAIAAIAACVAGCSSDQIREYSVSKEPASAMTPGSAMSASSEPQPTVEQPEWTLPAGWRERPGEGMRFATLVADSNDPPLEVRVTPLAPVALQLLANVNRWRGQIGLDPVTEERLPRLVRSERIGGRAVDRVDMTGPSSGGQPAIRVLAAILPSDDRVWFFLMAGPGDRVARQASNFDRLIRSLRLSAAPAMAGMPDGRLPDTPSDRPPGEIPSDHPPLGMPSDHPPVVGAPNDMPAGMPSDHPPVGEAQGGAGARAGAPEMLWTLPAGWREVPSTSGFRVGTFQFADGAQQGEVAITRFPGGAGGELQNINRWRGQVGLPPVTSPQQQPTQRVRVAGVESARVDLASASSAADATRMIVVTLPRGDITYFIKMTGPDALLDRRRKEFDAFLASVHFPKSDS